MFRTVKIVHPCSDDGYPLVLNDDIPSGKMAMKNNAYPVSNPKNFPIVRDDIVEIYLPTGRTIRSTALTFFPPLLMFLVGYFLSINILPDTISKDITAFTRDELAFLAGITSLLLTLPLMIFARSRTPRDFPKITRILTPSEARLCRMRSDDTCGSCNGCGGEGK